MLIVFWGDWSMMHALRLHWFWGVYQEKSREYSCVRRRVQCSYFHQAFISFPRLVQVLLL